LGKKRVGKIISWILLTLAVITIVLVFWPPDNATQPSDPQAAQSFDQKLTTLEDAHVHGVASQVKLTGLEVNSKLQQVFGDLPTSGLTRMRGVAISLNQNDLVAVFSLKILGVGLYITLGGKPGVQDHRLQFDLDEVRLGHMPTSSSLISAVIQQKLSSQGGQDMMIMPIYITSMQVENGELVVESK
jgi:hypothetical protein